MSEHVVPQLQIEQLYQIQRERWESLNIELFGMSANSSKNPFFIKENLDSNCEDYWINGTNKIKERLLNDGVLRNANLMLKDSWRLTYNSITNVVALSACFILGNEDNSKFSDELYTNVVDYINSEMTREERENIIKLGKININDVSFLISEVRLAYFPLVTSLGYIMKNSENVLRIKAVPNDYLIRKMNGVVSQKGWTYKDGKFEDGVNHFKDVHESQYPFLNAILGEQVTEENFTKALDLMPEYEFSSTIYFRYEWFDEIERNVMKGRNYCDPKNGKSINYINLINSHNAYANLKSKEVYTNLIIVKNKIKALETTRSVVWVPIADYLGDFRFSDTENVFDAFKTITSGMAGRTRLLLDDIYVEDGMLKVDYNGKTYNQYDIIFNRIPDYNRTSNLSCISRAPYNYLNDAKRIMYCAKLRGQSVRVKGQLEDLTHEVPARIVFADWKGYSFGDSFIISKSYAEKLEREVTQKFQVPKKLAKLYEAGQEITIDDLLLFAQKNRFSSWRDIRVTSVYGTEIEVTARAPFGVGDKISNLHGSKGIVSIILPDEKMPILKNDLSDSMKAGPIDIIVPGISVFRRKSTGQMFEAVTRALGLPEMPLEQLYKEHKKEIAKYDKASVFEFDGKEFSAPCGINNFLRLDHDATSKQSFAYIKSNTNFNLHLAEMELLNLAARGFYNILNETDVRSLNKHEKAYDLIKKVQQTGQLRYESANGRELFDYMKYLGWDLKISGVIQPDEIDSRWDSLMNALNNDEIDIF